MTTSGYHREDRERRELLTIFGCACVVILAMVTMTVWFYGRSSDILAANLRQELLTFADLASQQFSAEEIESIRDAKDVDTDLFRTLVGRAGRIKESIPNIRYVYVMRPTDDPKILSFVLEDDMLVPVEEQDENGNGIVEDDEHIPLPGEHFDASDADSLLRGFTAASADDEPTHDQWGWWMSGYAPIRDTDGKAVALIGLDMSADHFVTSTRSIFSPILLAFILVGFLALMTGFLGFLWQRRIHLLHRMERQRSAMITVASHKLGGPIATVRWWVELLQGEGSVDKQQVRESVKELSGAVERLSDVVKQLNDATMVDGMESDLWERLAVETRKEIDCQK